MSGWNIPDDLFAADEIDDLTLSQACETIEIRVITKLPNSEQSYKGKVKTHRYYKETKSVEQPENCENRNDSDLVQAFLKKWWVESDFKAPNLPLSLRLKGSGCHYNSIYNNTGTK